MVISNNIHTFNFYLIFVPLTYHELKAPSDINKNEDLTSNNHGNSGSSKLILVLLLVCASNINVPFELHSRILFFPHLSTQDFF